MLTSRGIGRWEAGFIIRRAKKGEISDDEDGETAKDYDAMASDTILWVGSKNIAVNQGASSSRMCNEEMYYIKGREPL